MEIKWAQIWGTGDKRLGMVVNIIQLNMGRRSVVADSIRDRLNQDLRKVPLILLLQEPAQKKIKGMVLHEHILTKEEHEKINKEKAIRKKCKAGNGSLNAPCRDGTNDGQDKSLAAWVPGLTGIRANIMIDENLNKKSGCHMLTQFTDPDQVAVRLKLENSNGTLDDVVICSAYFPGNVSAEGMVI